MTRRVLLAVALGLGSAPATAERWVHLAHLPGEATWRIDLDSIRHGIYTKALVRSIPADRGEPTLRIQFLVDCDTARFAKKWHQRESPGSIRYGLPDELLEFEEADQKTVAAAIVTAACATK